MLMNEEEAANALNLSLRLIRLRAVVRVAKDWQSFFTVSLGEVETIEAEMADIRNQLDMMEKEQPDGK